MKTMVKLYVEKLHDDAVLPEKGSTHAAAYDVRAYLNKRMVTFAYTKASQEYFARRTRVGKGERALIPTGLKVSATLGFQVDVRSRSGMPFKTGLIVGNGVGLVDPDYRGELFILLINTSDETVTIDHGDKIAQIQVLPTLELDIVEGELPPVESTRDGGFGSTGK